jgi:hypothetical protein
MSDEVLVPSLQKIQWMFPQDLEDGQEASIHVVGIAIAPFFDFYGDRFGNFGTFFTGKVERITDDNGKLVAVQIGYYLIPEDLLDHPRVTAVIGT